MLERMTTGRSHTGCSGPVAAAPTGSSLVARGLGTEPRRVVKGKELKPKQMYIKDCLANFGRRPSSSSPVVEGRSAPDQYLLSADGTSFSSSISRKEAKRVADLPGNTFRPLCGTCNKWGTWREAKTSEVKHSGCPAWREPLASRWMLDTS